VATAPTPQTPAALAFLQQWRLDGPWVLTAIMPDRSAISTDTFTNVADAERWLDRYNGQRNIYFHVNPCLRPLTKKAEREDVEALAWLHVDIDPRVGEDIETERDRALALLQKPPGDVPPPTVIIFSGGGYQGFWKLAEPVPIDGDLEKAEEAKLYNLQLEIVFNADQCHNVDRIMRLPGTINLPDAKKAKKGRVPTLAMLVEFHDDRIYHISDFTPAPAIQTGDPGFSPEETVQISGNVPRVLDLSELDRWDVSDELKVIIAHGRNPDKPKDGDDSRSAWLFDACCNLVRKDVPDETIYALITDPDWRISESVLESARPEVYARRQIARAKEFVADPRLADMNQKFAVIENIGGKCRVVEEQQDTINGHPRSRLTMQGFADFRNRFMHQRIEIGADNQGNPRFMSQGDWWLKHPRRKQFSRLIFDPSKEEIPGTYNLWKGFAYDARPGNCTLYLDHLENVLCQGDQDHYSYLLGWMAMLIQRPATPGQVAVVLRGKRGTGKGFFATQLGALLGRHFLHVSHASHLVGNFNSHLRDALLVFADEAFYAGDKKHESVLKTLITEDQLTVEAKGVDAESSPNYIHLILASNEHWVVPAGGDERRFFVLELADEHKQDGAYFSAIDKQMSEGGREALLHFLMTYDISEFDVRAVPATSALREQQDLSLTPHEEWWYAKLVDGIMMPNLPEPWPRQVMKAALRTDYLEYAHQHRIMRIMSPTQMGLFLKRECPGIVGRQIYQKNHRPYIYDIPPLAVCRADWDRLHGRTEWGEEAVVIPEDEAPF